MDSNEENVKAELLIVAILCQSASDAFDKGNNIRAAFTTNNALDALYAIDQSGCSKSTLKLYREIEGNLECLSRKLCITPLYWKEN